MIAPHDYTYMFWAHGWRGRSPDGKRVMCLRTGTFGAAFDTETASLLHLGTCARSTSAASALTETNDAIYSLAPATLRWSVTVEGLRYCVSGCLQPEREQQNLESLGLPLSLLDKKTPGEQTRMIASGRYVQRFDMEQLCFEDDEGNALPIYGRVEVTAQPDVLALTLELSCNDTVAITSVDASLNVNGFSVRPPSGDACSVTHDETTSQTRVSKALGGTEHVKRRRLSFFLVPDTATPEIEAFDASCIRASGISPYCDTLAAEYDSDRGLYWIPLPGLNEHWDIQHNRDMMERVKLTITNPGDRSIRVPLVFSKQNSFVGVTGLTPMLRDTAGQPLGIPVQICKNWHSTAGKTFLYQGPWFQGYTILSVGPKETFDCELTIAYAQWGGLPAASHGQLCLIGYGGNQLWDEVAIGSYGESITYDPDVNLGRSMIDDVRPLMVASMGGDQWSWTNNVGGGDFLVYFNEHNEKQFLTRMKAFYEHYGPNLTRVHYAGLSADEKIEAHVTVATPRCDDITRATHRFRYDVKEAVTFTRLAFYQLGADGYNNHQFNRMAWGNKDGMRKEWSPGKGGRVYEMTGLACDGEQVWFSLHDAVAGLTHSDGFRDPKGAWANRGIIVRSWSARLGGQDVPIPHASVFLTDDCIASANVELSAPPDLSDLLPGDYVECEVEFVILPMHAANYYGPNEGLRACLEASPNSWESVHRQARGNDLAVQATRGSLLQQNPVVVRVDDTDTAEFRIEGGISFVPITLKGLSTHAGLQLQERHGETWSTLDQSVHGNDFWQTEYDAETQTWTRIYNIERNEGCDAGVFRFGRT